MAIMIGMGGQDRLFDLAKLSIGQVGGMARIVNFNII
jgi:hypothetical protein